MLRVVGAPGARPLPLTPCVDHERCDDGVVACHRHADGDLLFADYDGHPENRVLSFVGHLRGSALLRSVDLSDMAPHHFDEGDLTVQLFSNKHAFHDATGPVDAFVLLLSDADGETVDAALMTELSVAERVFAQHLQGWD